VEVKLHSFFTSALHGGKSSILAALTQEKFPVTHFTGGWIGPAANPGGFAEGENFPLAGIEHQTVQNAVTFDNDHGMPGPLIFK